MPAAPTPRRPLLLAAILVLGLAYLALELVGGHTPETPPSTAASTEDPGYGERPPRPRGADDLSSPDNLLQCFGEAYASPRNLLEVELLPTAGPQARRRLWAHLSAEPLDSTLPIANTVIIMLPGAVTCLDRTEAIDWLLSQPIVRAAAPLPVSPRV